MKKLVVFAIVITVLLHTGYAIYFYQNHARIRPLLNV